MVYKRKRPGAYIGKRRYKRRATRRARVGRLGRRGFRMRIPAHRFHRWITAFNSTAGGSFVNLTNATYDGALSWIECNTTQRTASFSLAFQLNDLPGLTDFTQLFDTYMLTGVMLQFKLIDNPDALYISNSDPVANNRCNFFPTVWYVSDDDDNNTVTLPAIKEFERVKHRVLYPNRELNIMLRPKTMTQLYRSSTTTGYATGKRAQWLDMAQVDIPHYGFKCVFDFEGLPLVQSFRIKVNAKYYFKCKNVR